MKIYRMVVFILYVFALAGVSYGQGAAKPEELNMPPAASAALQAELTATEKGLWDAWKNNNAAPFKDVLRNDVVSVSHSGVSGKADVLSRLSSKGCDLKDYSLEDFKLIMVDEGTALLIFKGAYTCSGQNRRSGFFSTIFTKAGGLGTAAGGKAGSSMRKVNRSVKWINVFCQESSN